MITSENKVFLISGKRYSYALYVNAAGYLQHAYYGKKIEMHDLKYYIGNIGVSYEPKKDDINYDMSFDTMPSEYGFFAHGDFREPTAVFVRSDGSAMSRLRYLSYEIYDDVPAIKGMPHVRRGGQTLCIKLKDDFSEIEVALYYTAFDDCDVLVRNAAITNTGKENVFLEKAFSFCAELPSDEYRFLRLCGSWAAERSVEVTLLKQGITKIQSLRGASSHQTNPFAAVMRKGCSDEAGECYGAQLIYSGSFAITAEKVYNGSVRIQGGINDTGFSWNLKGGETCTTPQAALCYSDGGLGQMSREYSDFLRGYVINPRFVNRERPIVVNNWEATYFNFDNEKLFPIIDEAARLGIDTFVLDDGWFGKRNDDKSGLGDWFVNENKLKGGLKNIIDRCKKQGLKFGLWFEPEAISEDSELYRAHPEWAIGKEGVAPARWRNQLCLDLTQKQVVDYVFNAVAKILKDNDISYVKWDFNRSITEFYSSGLECQGEFAHRYILGVYELAERLTDAFPDILFEGCAGGGGRFDAGMLYYFPQIWTSDDTDAYERAKIQWGTSICYPLSAMSCHVSACPNHQTGRTTPLGTRGAMASLGAFGYELDLSKLSDDEKEQVRRQIINYRQISEIVLKGDLYRLSNPFESNYFGAVAVSKDKSKAYFVLERIHAMPNDYPRVMRLCGLDRDKIYEIKETGVIASGNALMSMGVELPRIDDYGGCAWQITEVSSKRNYIYKE